MKRCAFKKGTKYEDNNKQDSENIDTSNYQEKQQNGVTKSDNDEFKMDIEESSTDNKDKMEVE